MALYLGKERWPQSGGDRSIAVREFGELCRRLNLACHLVRYVRFRPALCALQKRLSPTYSSGVGRRGSGFAVSLRARPPIQECRIGRRRCVWTSIRTVGGSSAGDCRDRPAASLVGDEKLKIVVESFQSRRQVAATARRHGVSRWQLHEWPRAFRTAQTETAGPEAGFAAARQRRRQGHASLRQSCLTQCIGQIGRHLGRKHARGNPTAHAEARLQLE